MIFDYNFLKDVPRPKRLGMKVQQYDIRGTTLPIVLLFIGFVALFAFRAFWGFGTESTTALVVTDGVGTFALARILRLVGTILGGLLYVTFLLYGIPFLLSTFTDIAFKQWIPVQIGITAIVFFALVIDTLLGVMTGLSTNASIFSFGPIAWTYIDNEFFILLLNQISLVLFLVIFMQYDYAKGLQPSLDTKRLLFTILTLYLFIILIISTVQMIPFDKLATFIIGGGVS